MLIRRGMGTTDVPQCPMDARFCSDGTVVGRLAPDCEFAPCPDEQVPIDDGGLSTDTVLEPETQVLPPVYVPGYSSIAPRPYKPWYQRETPIQIGNGRVEYWMVGAALVAGFLLFKAGGSQ